MADCVTKTEVRGEIKALMRHVGQGRAWSLPQKKGFCDILQTCGITRPQVRALARVARRGSECADSADRRLRRQLDWTCYDDAVDDFCLREACDRMADGATIAIDHTDLDHPYGTEEGLDYFPSWDGSRHVASMGDTATTIFLLTPGSREGFPVSCRLHETRLTPTQRTVQALERVGEMKRRTGKQVMCVMDRGMDALEIYHAAMRCDVPIVVRARHKRDLVCGSPLPLEEALKRHPFRRTPLRKGELLPRFAIPKKCPPPDQRFDT